MDNEYIFANTPGGFREAKALCSYASWKAMSRWSEDMAAKKRPGVASVLENPPADYPPEVREAICAENWGRAAKLIREAIYSDVRQLKKDAGID